jgi:hypothetical protein
LWLDGFASISFPQHQLCQHRIFLAPLLCASSWPVASRSEGCPPCLRLDIQAALRGPFFFAAHKPRGLVPQSPVPSRAGFARSPDFSCLMITTCRPTLLLT